jgi:hypothetical protein
MAEAARTRPIVRLLGGLLGAILLGAAAFAGGFWGPLVLAPDANQGPLLGFFVTGPAGFVVGAVLGAGYGPTLWQKARDRWG